MYQCWLDDVSRRFNVHRREPITDQYPREYHWHYFPPQSRHKPVCREHADERGHLDGQHTVFSSSASAPPGC